MKKLFRSPFGFHLGTRKHDKPTLVLASTRKASHIGAEQKYLCPVRRYSDPLPTLEDTGFARVELALTSDPPCFSVINMPIVPPNF